MLWNGRSACLSNDSKFFAVMGEMDFLFKLKSKLSILAALHNFLSNHGSDPEEEANELERLGLLESDSDPSPQSPDEIDDRDMIVRRDEIAEMMWEQWGDIVRGRAENH